MWIYLAYLGILVPGGLRPIALCPSPFPEWRAIIAILWSKLQGPDYRSFHFSHAPALTIGSTSGLLVGCSGGQFAQHW